MTHRTDPNAIAAFRATTARMKTYSHVRKRCGCGRVATAIDIERYGLCAKCIRAKYRPKP